MSSGFSVKAPTLVAISLLELVDSNNKDTNLRSLNTDILEVIYKKRKPTLFTFLALGKESYSSPDGHIVNLFFKSMKGQALAVDVLCHCSCPAFQYWGAAYNATEGKYNFRGKKEKRPPNDRDPQRKNKVCKHIAALRVVLNRTTVAQMMKRGSRKLKSSINQVPQVGIHSKVFLNSLHKVYHFDVDKIANISDGQVEALMIKSFKE